MAYQSFDDRRGGSKSSEKLASLKLPKDLTGKRVLDLGCNEGFFSIEAKKRGAAYVMGVDAHQGAIDNARERAKSEGLDIEFFVGDFLNAPGGNYDIILLLSALHYAPNPKAVLRRVHDLLSPNGVFILEYGVIDQPGRNVSRVLRSIDERFFPSLELLRDDWLDVFAVRSIGMSVQQAGDPIPRRVFRCVKRKPTVVFVCGRGGVGKSSISRQFKDPLIIQTDAIISPRRNPSRSVITKEQTIMDEAMAKHGSHIGKAWNEVRTNPDVVRYFAGVVAAMIDQNKSVDLIVVEGFMAADLAPIVMADAKDEFVVWNLTVGVGQAQFAAETADQDMETVEPDPTPPAVAPKTPRPLDRKFADATKFRGRVRMNNKGMAVGWLCGPNGQTAEVEVLADGRRLGVVKADRPSPRAKELGVSQTGLCGFQINFDMLVPGGLPPNSVKLSFKARGGDYELEGSPIARETVASAAGASGSA